MHRSSGLALSLLLAFSTALSACKREPQPTPAPPVAPEAPAAAPEAPPAAPESFPPAPCAETDALLRRPAAAVSASVDLEPLRELLAGTGEVSEEGADRLKAAGPAAAPMAELVAARIIAAPAEEAARLLEALSVIAPEVAVTTAAKLIDTGAAEPSRLKLSVAASALISLGEPGFNAFMLRATREELIAPPLRTARIERMSGYPSAAYDLLFQKEGFCTANPKDAGCAALLRELLLARPSLIAPSKEDPIMLRLQRTEAALMRGKPEGAAWQKLVADGGLPLERRIDSFETINPVVPAAVAVPAALHLFQQPLPLRTERAIALWLISRSGALRDPALLAMLEAPADETPGHLVARALIRFFAGDPALAAANTEQLRLFGVAERNDLAGLAQLVLLKLGQYSLLTHTTLNDRVPAWTALMAAKSGTEILAMRRGELKEANQVMFDDAAVIWSIGREADLAKELAGVSESADRIDALRFADRLGPAGAAIVAAHLASPPNLDAADAVASLATTISAEQAKPWIDAAVADPRTEIAALKLAALSGYLPRQEVLIPVLLRERDARKTGVLRQVDATRYAQLLLIRQPQLSVERLAASRRQLSPADAGFSALGLVLFAATYGCSTSPETL